LGDFARLNSDDNFLFQKLGKFSASFLRLAISLNVTVFHLETTNGEYRRLLLLGSLYLHLVTHG
jgi:hypothetical protein